MERVARDTFFQVSRLSRLSVLRMPFCLKKREKKTVNESAKYATSAILMALTLTLAVTVQKGNQSNGKFDRWPVSSGRRHPQGNRKQRRSEDISN